MSLQGWEESKSQIRARKNTMRHARLSSGQLIQAESAQAAGGFVLLAAEAEAVEEEELKAPKLMGTFGTQISTKESAFYDSQATEVDSRSMRHTFEMSFKDRIRFFLFGH